MTRIASYSSALVTCFLYVNQPPNMKAAGTPSLQVSLAANTLKTIAEGAPFSIAVRLKNTSTAPISLPALDAISQQTYLSLIATDTTGNQVLFLPKFVDQPATGALATQTQQLKPQEEIMLSIVLNESGAGALLYKSNPPSIQPYTGDVHLKAVFSVDRDHQPLVTDPLLFLGSVASSDTELPLAITIIPKASGDVDADGAVTCKDLAIVRLAFTKKCTQPGFDTRADIDNSCTVDIRDLATVAQKLPSGTVCQ
jgi:hypothetical protein